MSFKAYSLFTPPDNEPDAIVLANSPEEAAALLGAEFRGEVGENTWDVVFPAQLFDPPRRGSEEERLSDGMWHHYIQARDGRRISLLLNLEGEAELLMRLQERPVVSKE